jgi:hypothetical protein
MNKKEGTDESARNKLVAAKTAKVILNDPSTVTVTGTPSL